MCQHQPPCPSSTSPDRDAARLVTAHAEQGWTLLCNGVIAFDDGGDLLPDGRAVPPVVAARPPVVAPPPVVAGRPAVTQPAGAPAGASRTLLVAV